MLKQGCSCYMHALILGLQHSLRESTEIKVFPLHSNAGVQREMAQAA